MTAQGVVLPFMCRGHLGMARTPFWFYPYRQRTLWPLILNCFVGSRLLGFFSTEYRFDFISHLTSSTHMLVPLAILLFHWHF